MSITLEEAQVVNECLQRKGEGIDTVENIANTLRKHGVRLLNAEKNIGKRSFAFNSLQRVFLPAALKPSKENSGKGVES